MEQRLRTVQQMHTKIGKIYQIHISHLMKICTFEIFLSRFKRVKDKTYYKNIGRTFFFIRILFLNVSKILIKKSGSNRTFVKKYVLNGCRSTSYPSESHLCSFI